MTQQEVVVLASFDDLDSRQMRFLEEAATIAPVHVLLLSDRAAARLEGRAPTFPQQERRYLVEAIRYVNRVTLVDGPLEPDTVPAAHVAWAAAWVVREADTSPAKRAFCEARGLPYRVIVEAQLEAFPDDTPMDRSKAPAGRKKVVVTGCYDWFHSGHVRFFEEVSQLGDLYVVVGHDENIKLLKGEGHPMFPAIERRYMVASIRHVKQALISSGDGWLDAEPEIQQIRPDIYAVNEDGDRPEKRAYCRSHGIEYRVLLRLPKEGLPKRQSTDLRGF